MIQKSFNLFVFNVLCGIDLHLLKVPTPKMTPAGSSNRSMTAADSDIMAESCVAESRASSFEFVDDEPEGRVDDDEEEEGETTEQEQHHQCSQPPSVCCATPRRHTRKTIR